jgi:hypothetical protein
MPTALIKYSQGGINYPAGRAGFGSTGAQVDVANTNAVGVASWKLELVYVPPGSAVVTGLLASANDANPAASFTPDKVGSYRVVLTVYASINQLGAKDIDIRDFVIAEPRYGFVFPPYQQLPDRRPILGSGAVGEKPDEMNYRDNPYGWDGDGNDGLMLDVLRQLGNSTLDRIPDPDTGLVGQVLEIAEHVFTNPRATITDTLRVFVLEASFLSKGNQSGFRETLDFGGGVDLFNGVFANESIWLVGAQGGTNGTILEAKGVKTTMEVGSGGFLDSAPGFSDIFWDIAFDGTDLWVVGSVDKLIRCSSVDGLQIGSPLVLSGNVLDSNYRIVYDPVGANYLDTSPRLWVLGGTTAGPDPDTLYRVNPIGPAVDATLPLGSAHKALAVGLGHVWAATVSPATLQRIDPASATIDDSFDLTPMLTSVGGIEVDTIRNLVLIYGTAADGDAYYIEVDPVTMLQVGVTVQLTTTGLASVASTGHFVGASFTSPIGPFSGGVHTGVGGAWLPVEGGDPGQVYIAHAQAEQIGLEVLMVESQRRYVALPPAVNDATQIRCFAGAFTVPAGVAVGDLVYSTGNYTADKADNVSGSTAPAIGMVIAKPTATTATVAYAGEIPGFVGLTAGTQYFLGTSGAMVVGAGVPTAPLSISQEIGTALNGTTLLLAIKQHIVL